MKICHNIIVIIPFLRNLFFGNKERFLIIEILADKLTRLSLVKADLENKEFALSKIISLPDSNFIFLKKALKKFGKLEKYRTIISLDSKLASTIYSSVSLVRNNAKEPIDEADLDNLISQAVWKFFDRHRNKVAQKLQVDDFDVLLTDVRVENIRLDGYRVLNPLGFKARSVEIQLAQTFTSRSLINEFKSILPLSGIHFITEAGTAWSHIIAKTQRLPKFLLANIFSTQTSVFSTDDFRLAYHGGFDWGEKNLINALVEELGVDFEVAKAVLDLYRGSQTSPSFARKLERCLLKELDFLVNALNPLLAKADSRLLYLHSFFDLPALVLSNSFKNRFNFAVKLESIDHNFIIENHNFKLKLNKRLNSKTAFSILAVILESSLLSHYETVTQIAKRRVRWLSPI